MARDSRDDSGISALSVALFFFFFLLNVEKEGGRSRDDSVGESWRIAHKMGDAWPGETDEVDDKGSWRVERLSV